MLNLWVFRLKIGNLSTSPSRCSHCHDFVLTRLHVHAIEQVQLKYGQVETGAKPICPMCRADITEIMLIDITSVCVCP